jgi:O-succinylhomoserine sulfhydrylase
MNNDPWKYDTQAIRAGSLRSEFGENSEAIFLTSSYVFDSSAQAAARFAGTEPGNIYSRFTNPTVTMFQDRLAAMEGSEACVATSSGMSAILAIIMGLCSTGEHIVASRSIFGTTVQLFSNILKRWGLEITFVSLTNLNEWEDAIQKNTKLFFVETPSNPLTEVTDINALSKIAHQKDIKLIVDNCFCSPALQRPLLLGADIIIHSATKYLDGQGRCLGGAVLADKKTIEPIYQFLRSAGPTMSAFNAWVFLKGLETLSVRMDAHSKNALHLASWLESQPQIDRVYYPGLASHPQHKLALTQQKTGGAIVSFEVKGRQKEAWSLIDSTRLISITANLGDVPTTTTHSRVSPEERQKAGIKDNLVRIAVGLEDIEDLKADLSSLSR